MDKKIDYYLVSDNNPIPIEAKLLSHTDVGATFYVAEPVEIDETIAACPSFKSILLPEAADIRTHPKRIEGLVTRLGKNGQITVSFTDPEKPVMARIRVEGEGFQTTLSIEGTPTLPYVTKFTDRIMKKSPYALRFIIDLSHIVNPPVLIFPILKSVVKKLLSQHKHVLLVCPICEQRQRFCDLPDTPYFDIFSTLTEARDYLRKTPLRVFIIEDELGTQLLIEQMFRNWKCTTFCFDTAEEALQSMQKNKPDLIMMDIHLPGINGIETTEQIRKIPTLQYIPIIMLTSESRKEFVQKSMDCGINGYILKPFDPDTLLPKIIKILKHSAQ